MQGELSRNTSKLQILNMKGDSFTVDMEPFAHLSNKDLTLNSRIIRSPSRKEGNNKKMNSNLIMNDGDGDAIHSPKGSSSTCLMAGAMPEKLMLLDETTDHITCSPQPHHQISIMTGGTTPTISAATTKPPGTPTKPVFWKRSRSYKQSSSLINPRRILMFFATLSSMGTVLLICLTLFMSRHNEDDNSHV